MIVLFTWQLRLHVTFAVFLQTYHALSFLHDRYTLQYRRLFPNGLIIRSTSYGLSFWFIRDIIKLCLGFDFEIYVYLIFVGLNKLKSCDIFL